ncbi:MAG: BREX system Lon protease-like protein BrxL [Verrucomicrobia bacterium]|nr:BREX system Lon protease-like protein BrxL [Verrucomicrobiota bacterium]
MKSFETKAHDFYGEVVINKGLMTKAGFGARAIPVYVGEWIISQFLEDGEIKEEARERITGIVSKFLPQKADKNRILNDLKDHKPVQILDDFRVTVNLDKNTHELSIPVLDESHALIQKPILDNNPMLLKTGMWGLGTLQYVPPDGDEVKKGQIWMTDFKPFQTPGVDLEYYRESRKNFTLEEWINLLVSSCQFNPECHTLPQKMLLLARIIPLVQPRVNVVELAPKGTGKSFVFDNISRYAAVIPGGKLSAPSLFFNSNSRQIGLIPRYDVVVVDEIQKIQTDAAGEAMAALKMYLESGRYRRATGDMGTSESGFVMLGNITLTDERRPLYQAEGLFKELPSALQESAFIDRLHGLMEGWFMPRITKNTPSRHLGLKGDFFSEILHELRARLEFADYVSHSLRLPACEDMRDNKAIARLTEGYLKLLFPDLNLSDEQFLEYCVNPAVRMRQQIRDELAKIDAEYGWVSIRSSSPDEFQLLHPPQRPTVEAAAQQVDPLAPDRMPQACTVDLQEGQTGVSYRRLFEPYLRGAREIALVDPYIRLDYQIHNLTSFIDIVDPEVGNVSLDLITAAASNEEEVDLSAKLDQVQESANAKKITFSYRFDRTKHDRVIETDTGWRITLGRGLDIFYKPEGRFSLAFVDQAQRKCKETSIIFTRA